MEEGINRLPGGSQNAADIWPIFSVRNAFLTTIALWGRGV